MAPPCHALMGHTHEDAPAHVLKSACTVPCQPAGLQAEPPAEAPSPEPVPPPSPVKPPTPKPSPPPKKEKSPSPPPKKTPSPAPAKSPNPPIVGNSCATVTPGQNMACCKKKADVGNWEDQVGACCRQRQRTLWARRGQLPGLCALAGG